MAGSSRTVGAMRSARIAWAQCRRLCIGGSGIILNVVARLPGRTILDIVRAVGAINTWFVVMTALVGVGALTLHGYDVQRLLIWSAFGWFLLCALGYRGEHL